MQCTLNVTKSHENCREVLSYRLTQIDFLLTLLRAAPAPASQGIPVLSSVQKVCYVSKSPNDQLQDILRQMQGPWIFKQFTLSFYRGCLFSITRTANVRVLNCTFKVQCFPQSQIFFSLLAKGVHCITTCKYLKRNNETLLT